jgi:hypothetical protein
MHTQSPNKPKEFKQMSVRKLMATVFWDRKGVLMVEFMQQGVTVMQKCAAVHQENCVGLAI